MHAATWQRHRNVTYMGGRPGTKIYKSTDGGENWKHLKVVYHLKMGKIGLGYHLLILIFYMPPLN